MKKVFALLMALAMLCSAALAEADMVAQAVTLAQRMDALAGSSGYRSCVGMYGEMDTLLGQYAAGSHDQPRLVVAVDTKGYTDMVLGSVIALGFEVDAVAQAELVEKMSSAMVLQLVATKGTSILAAVSGMTTSTVFAREGEAARGVYLLLYEGATPIAVNWTAQNGAVSMNAYFLPDDELAACQSVQAVSDLLAARGMLVSCTLAE